jgi:hypothetical protein
LIAVGDKCRKAYRTSDFTLWRNYDDKWIAVQRHKSLASQWMALHHMDFEGQRSGAAAENINQWSATWPANFDTGQIMVPGGITVIDGEGFCGFTHLDYISKWFKYLPS